jgi:DNA modification methylase
MPKRPVGLVTVRALADLHADPRNANRGTDRGRAALERSLRTYGAGRAILIDRHGHIIAGHKTVAEAKRLNLPLRVVRTDGTQLVAVQRADLDVRHDPRAQELAVADNRVGELDLEWDVEMLKQLRTEGLDLSAFWSEEFTSLLGSDDAADEKENAVVEPGPTDIQQGDLFTLGAHRLLCGDATAAADVDRVLDGEVPLVMVSDPPYGVAYDPAWRHDVHPSQRTAVGRVANDDRAEWAAAWRLFPGDVCYVWHAGLKAGLVAADLEAAGFAIRSQIIWRKQHFALSRGHFHWAHEPAWYAIRKGATAHWRGGRKQTTVWEIPNLNPMGGTRVGNNAISGHATQKPVALFEIPIQNHTVAGDGIYDPFCGSGTAVIAAEKWNRRCYALEIEPRYVQAAVTRWETFTGQKATLSSRAAR